MSGIRYGFRLGFHALPPKSATRNKKSAEGLPAIVEEYLNHEVTLGRVAGPFSFPPLPDLHISSFGVIPKSGQPGKWRLIIDLSALEGRSVNDGIDPDNFSLQYIKVDDVITMVGRLGVGALMAKFDVLSAFRNVPIHPADRHLLGMKWRGNYYVDLALPFGLRSAPFIFDSIASLVEWILRHNYHVSSLLHYLDDFITAGPPESPVCSYNLATAINVCSYLGLPLHPDKCEGPSSSLVILGIELDSVTQTARLPETKLSQLRALLDHWANRQWCRRSELESLIGHLHHAAKVVWPGRTFIRRMINLLSCFRDRNHPIRLNLEFRLDLTWWRQFLLSWNGVSFWLYPGLSQPASV
ncbi:MAG: reverse transcriptase domain-containing protein, partial [Bacteroidota bacterium]